jgi:hypothetical protein
VAEHEAHSAQASSPLSDFDVAPNDSSRGSNSAKAPPQVKWDDEQKPLKAAPPQEDGNVVLSANDVEVQPTSRGGVEGRPDAAISTTHVSKNPIGARPSHYNSLPTGTRIADDLGTTGHGKLTVENGTGDDAVVRLFDFASGKTVRWFFVQAHSTAHIGEVPRGTYKLAFTTGLNWDTTNDSFTWNPSCNEFDRMFNFTEERDSDGIEYHDISVTLNSVPSGNVRTKRITRDEFMRGHLHVLFQE